VLDPAHLGDIDGALGSISRYDCAPRRSWPARLQTLLAVMGPGLVVMVADNDAGGIASYAQAGQDYGTRLLWVLLLLLPVLVVNQEMVCRLGAVSGVGHARLILERFGRFWGAFSVADLFLLNALTLITEFIGVTLALAYFGVGKAISVPAAAVLLVAVTATGSFRRWERVMYVLIGVNLLAIPLALWVRPAPGLLVRSVLAPTVPGGRNGAVLLLVIALAGTTIAPWQLFFQQASVVDKRITPRWLGYERADTVIGAVVLAVVGAALLVVVATGFAGTPLAGRFSDAGAVAQGLGRVVGPWAGALFALVLLEGSLLGAVAVTLATAYTLGDVTRARHSLHHRPRQAPLFYSAYVALVALAAAIVVLPDVPLGLITIGVQALAGVLLPSAAVFLLLLCNDHEVLGPWANRPWLNVVASVTVGLLVVVSLAFTATTLFPDLSRSALGAGLAGATAVGLVVAVCGLRREAAARTSVRVLAQITTGVDRASWRTPPLSELRPPHWSPARKLALLLLLRGYVLVAALLVVVKVVQLALAR
jgi:NRAMP (natural resistance-associated macrophage protein)-like metal ion transporter